MSVQDSIPNNHLLKELRLHKPQRSRSINLINQIFDRLTPFGLVGVSPNGDAIWLCRCECNRFAYFRASHLRKGRDASCGLDRLPWEPCYKRIQHGHASTPAYSRWVDMMTRCYNPKFKQYADWGARGISVCSRWHSFLNFLEDIGQPSKSRGYLERRDNDGNYEPDNCYWATKTEQARNTRANRLITHDTETMCLSAWAERTGIKATIIADRLDRNWSVEEAFELIQRTRFLGAYTVYLTANGETRALPDWAKDRGLTKSAIRNRLARGWTHAQALGFQTPPPRSRWTKRAY